MPKFSRRDPSGYAVDVVEAASASAAAKMFGGAFKADDFYPVPDETEHGAKLTVQAGRVSAVENRTSTAPSADQARAVAIKAELQAADADLDRDREDQWLAMQKIADTVGAGNVIPDAKKRIIERKNSLREELAGLE